MPSVEFAYNSTTSIPAAGNQRKTYNIVLADDRKFRVIKVGHELLGFETHEEVVGLKKILSFKIGADILMMSADASWFLSFFSAKHRWVVYKNFNDPANSGNNNLCKSVLTDEEIHIGVFQDLNGMFVLESEKVF